MIKGQIWRLCDDQRTDLEAVIFTEQIRRPSSWLKQLRWSQDKLGVAKHGAGWVRTLSHFLLRSAENLQHSFMSAWGGSGVWVSGLYYSSCSVCLPATAGGIFVTWSAVHCHQNLMVKLTCQWQQKTASKSESVLWWRSVRSMPAHHMNHWACSLWTD